MDISPIRVRVQCCAHLRRLRWGPRVVEQFRQGAQRGKVDVRSSRDAPARAEAPIEHPPGNLQPAIRYPARKTAAENLCFVLVDHFMNMDLATRPGMPWIEKLALRAGVKS
jgi:hypothetical protein